MPKLQAPGNLDWPCSSPDPWHEHIFLLCLFSTLPSSNALSVGSLASYPAYISIPDPLPPYSKSHLRCCLLCAPLSIFPTPCSPSILFFQSSSQKPSTGQVPGPPRCLGKEFRLAVGTAQKSSTNSLIRCSLPLGGRRGREPKMSSQSHCGGLAIGIQAPDHHSSRENEPSSFIYPHLYTNT